MKKITVLIITYNQQDTIGRALDSILSQKEWGLHEIVICDDCSSDNNWDIIQQYVNSYPTIIRAYRNNPNLGIYNNVEKTYELRGDADLFVNLAGDDVFCPGYFENVQRFIENNNICIEGTATTISTDFQIHRPDGRIINIRMNKVIKDISGAFAFRLKFRGVIHTRGALMTSEVMNRYRRCAENKTITLAEVLNELQPFSNADRVCYMPYISSVYYTQIGISTTMKNKNQYKKEIEKWEYVLNNLNLCEKDKNWTKMRIHLACYSVEPSLKAFYLICKYFILSRDFSIPLNYTSLFFSIRTILKATFGN